jgi:hypothetical protein
MPAVIFGNWRVQRLAKFQAIAADGRECPEVEVNFSENPA